MHYLLLGPLEVRGSGGIVNLGGPRRERALAALLVQPNAVVPLSTLVDTLWETDTPASAIKQVRNDMSALRAALGHVPGQLLTSTGGYRLQIDEQHLDSAQFHHRVHRSEQLQAAGQVRAAADTLADALQLWHGSVLAGMTGPPLEPFRAGLEHQRLRAIDTLGRLYLQLGDGERAIALLTEAVAANPLREPFVSHLMQALWSTGRRAEALASFRRLRAQLVDDLGIEPGPQLQQLYAQILRGTPPDPARHPDGRLQAGPRRPAHRPRFAGSTSVPGPPPTGPAAAPTSVRPAPRQLPAAVRLAGREQEFATLDGFAADDPPAGVPRILVLHGPPGVGKTALAVGWAHRLTRQFSDGQLFAGLRAFDPTQAPADPADVLQQFLCALGVPAGSVPSDRAARESMYRGILHGRRVLVLLDNAWGAAQIRPLLPGTPGCLVVVTSRTRLTGLVATNDAHQLEVTPLSPAGARRLLDLRLGPLPQAAEPAVAQVIHRCAGLPLALAVVAARAGNALRAGAAWPPGAALSNKTMLDALRADDDASDIRTIFSWSYAALSTPAARMFRLLGTQPFGDLDGRAVASLAGLAPAAAARTLTELTDAHLAAESALGRYTMHDLLREYAAELGRTLDPDADRAEALDRLNDYYLHTATECAHMMNPTKPRPTLDPPRPGVSPETPATSEAALRWFDRERTVLLAILRTAEMPHRLLLPRALANYLDQAGWWQDLATVQRTCIQAAVSAGDADAEAQAHHFLGHALGRTAQFDEAVRELDTAIAQWTRLGNPTAAAVSHLASAHVLANNERRTEALQHAYTARQLFATDRHRVGEAVALNAIGYHHIRLGAPERGMRHCHRALPILRDLGHPHGEAATWDSLGIAHLRLGQFAKAQRCLHRALALYQRVRDRFYEAEALANLGDVFYASGVFDAAQAYWGQARAIFEELHHPRADDLRPQVHNWLQT